MRLLVIDKEIIGVLAAGIGKRNIVQLDEIVGTERVGIVICLQEKDRLVFHLVFSHWIDHRGLHIAIYERGWLGGTSVL